MEAAEREMDRPGLVDIHCHLLPGVDDGAADMASALDLVAAAANNGIRRAVLTPHVYPGRWDNSVAGLRPVFDSLCQAVQEAGFPIELRLGGEIHLLPESLEWLTSGRAPMLGGWQGKRVALIELPDGRIPVGTDSAMRFLLRHGIVPMIAHPERNREIIRHPERIAPLVHLGCLLQITAASACGWFGRGPHAAARELIRSGWATVVATDAHNLRHRPPVLAEAHAALSADFGRSVADALTVHNPAAIFEGRALFEPEPALTS